MASPLLFIAEPNALLGLLHKEGQASRLMDQTSKAFSFWMKWDVPFIKKRAELLFSVISKNYEQQSII